jgi:ATP-dependent DNA helicase MPH1
MMAKNPHFRILALTATPGGDPTAVQDLIDGLHISRIEIRDENSLDLKAYIHHKVGGIESFQTTFDHAVT